MRTLNVCHLRWVAFVMLAILNLNESYPLEVSVKIPEGSPCDLKDSDSSEQATGTCVVVPKCAPMIKSLKAGRRNDFTRCGFSGLLEIICCPNDGIESSELHKNDDDKTITTSSTTAAPTTGSVTTSKAEVRGPVIRKSVEVCDDLAVQFNKILVTLQISGGQNAEQGEFPHMVALGYENPDEENKIDYNCGGTLISDQYVLTAAHCIVTQGANRPVRARMGITNLNSTADTGESVGIANFTIHPKYQRLKKQNDIALIQLERKVKFNNELYPACLYTKPDNPNGLVITGWGHLAAGGVGVNNLQKGLVSPIDNDSCKESHSKLPVSAAVISEKQLCASANGTDACQGDSGGPIQIVRPDSKLYYVIGVTSYGWFCASKVPGVYTRVYSYLSWIENIVWPE